MDALNQKITDLRLAVLRDYEIMDTPPEEVFDDITQLAAYICETPIATITLLDEKRQWFKSKVGVEGTENPITVSFCAHAIQQKSIFLVSDASKDGRFSSNPLVTGDPHIRSYVGSPLVTQGGVPFGTLCAIDREPRQFQPEQLAALASLSRHVVHMMELRKIAKSLQVALEEKREAELHVSLLRDILPMCAWCHQVRDDDTYWSSVESYISAHTNARVTHGICPACAAKVKSGFTN